MNTKTPSEESVSLFQVVEESEQLLDGAKSALMTLIAEIEQGKTERAKTLLPILSELRKGTWAVFDERKRAYEAAKKEQGVHSNYDFDLREAREEVERRMDSLRSEKNSG